MRSSVLSSNNRQGFWVTFILVSALFGLQIVMVIPISLGQATTPFSIVFRAVIFFISLRLIFWEILKKFTLPIKQIGIMWILFWVVYLTRLVYDLEIAQVHLMSPIFATQREQIYQFAFGATFIPILAIILNAKYVQIELSIKMLYWFSLLNTLAIIFITYKLLGTISVSAFASREALSSGIMQNSATGGMPINPITVSISGGSLSVISMCIFLLHQPSVKFRVLLSISFFLGLFVLFLGSSRGPMLSIILTAFLAIIFYMRKANFGVKKSLGVVITLLLFYFGALQFINSLGFELSMLDRLTKTVEDQQSGEGETRNELSNVAIEQFLNNPFIGDQIFERYEYSYPHNVILEAFMSTGVIGGIPLIIVFLVVLYNGHKTFRLKSSYSIFFLITFFQMVLGLTSSSIFSSPELWLPMTFVLIMNVPKLQITIK